MKKMLVAVLLVSWVISANADIIISQYYEGTSYNKWVELYNTGGSAVDLSAGNYYLGLWSNASREGWKGATGPNSTIALSGTLAAGATYLLSHSSATAPTYVSADLTSSTVCNFNGDDSLVLYVGSTYAFANVVDAFGLTGSGYADISYVRDPSISTGVNTDFNSDDWVQYAYTDVDTSNGTSRDLGQHAVIPEPMTASLFGIALAILGLIRRR
ncbi:MAG: lamin tail domain-containing protein [Kiritimatiellae bacterium]|nr:lamin tail domain-containing protein [Kiritimatiellia bacterium]